MFRHLDRARLFASALIGGGAICAATLLAPVPASAKTMKECGADYQAAKKAGTLNGQDWKAYRAANCSASATAPAAAAGTPATATATTTATTEKPAAAAPMASAPTPAAGPSSAPAAVPGKMAAGAAPAATPVATTTGTGNAVFPTAVASKYASLSAGKARMQTCLDQYNINKTSNGNGSLKWIQKGGGYYSECNKHLKGGN